MNPLPSRPGAPVDAQATDQGPRSSGRTTTSGRPCLRSADLGWDLLARVVELPYDVLLFEARQTIRMHEPTAVVQTRSDGHARWRDLIIRRDGPATYRRQRCGRCTDEGCDLLDTAKEFEKIIAPYLEGP
jgi:hypothetical protein